MVLNADGEWSKKEIAGPPDLHSWLKSYKTFRAAMLLLQAADAERLDAYADHERDLAQQFGPAAWSIVYTADCRMRSEFMERVRRQLVESPRWGFTAASPWSAVFAGAVREHEFWLKEVTTPATLLLARNKALPAAESSEDDADQVHEGRKQQPHKRGKKRKIAASESKAQWDQTLKAYTLNRKGIQVCQKFSRGACGHKGDARPTVRISAINASAPTWARTALARRSPDRNQKLNRSRMPKPSRSQTEVFHLQNLRYRPGRNRDPGLHWSGNLQVWVQSRRQSHRRRRARRKRRHLRAHPHFQSLRNGTNTDMAAATSQRPLHSGVTDQEPSFCSLENQDQGTWPHT